MPSFKLDYFYLSCHFVKINGVIMICGLANVAQAAKVY